MVVTPRSGAGGDAQALERVRADPSLLLNAAEESLRLEPAAATFEESDAFRLDDRTPRAISCPAGPHVYIGMHLARLEAHTALARTLDRLPNLRLDPAFPPPVARGLVFRKPALRVKWD